MGKPLDGPDWTDIRQAMWDTGSRQACSVSLEIIALGGQYSAALCVVASASWPDMSKPMGSDGVLVQIEWPNRENRTLAGAAFRALLLLDLELDKCRQARANT